jgi:hypothetical protein
MGDSLAKELDAGLTAIRETLLGVCTDIAAGSPHDPVHQEAAAALQRFVELSMRYAQLQGELTTVQRELNELAERFRQLGLARGVAPTGRQ